MLQRSLPEGLLADSAWMEKHGYSRALRKKYVAHGWLDQVSRGLYRRPVPETLTGLVDFVGVDVFGERFVDGLVESGQ